MAIVLSRLAMLFLTPLPLHFSALTYVLSPPFFFCSCEFPPPLYFSKTFPLLPSGLPHSPPRTSGYPFFYRWVSHHAHRWTLTVGDVRNPHEVGFSVFRRSFGFWSNPFSFRGSFLLPFRSLLATTRLPSIVSRLSLRWAFLKPFPLASLSPFKRTRCRLQLPSPLSDFFGELHQE